MKIACLCPTFNRPAQLAEAVESFLRQTYPAELRELVILDDAGQYDPAACDHLPGVKLITTRHRYRTLGEKRNATAALASPDVEAYAVWDDDDIYLPWHLEAMVQVFAAGSPWSRPAEVWIDRRSYLERKPSGGLFHGSWGFTRQAFLSVGGYPAMQSGQDQALAGRLKKAGFKPVSPSELVTPSGLTELATTPSAKPVQPRSQASSSHQAPVSPVASDTAPSPDGGDVSCLSLPSYIYRWHTYPNARHISALGKDGYELRAKEEIVHVERVTPHWTQAWDELADTTSCGPTASPPQNMDSARSERRRRWIR